jgi:hypothetical protein
MSLTVPTWCMLDTFRCLWRSVAFLLSRLASSTSCKYRFDSPSQRCCMIQTLQNWMSNKNKQKPHGQMKKTTKKCNKKAMFFPCDSHHVFWAYLSQLISVRFRLSGGTRRLGIVRCHWQKTPPGKRGLTLGDTRSGTVLYWTGLGGHTGTHKRKHTHATDLVVLCQ